MPRLCWDILKAKVARRAEPEWRPEMAISTRQESQEPRPEESRLPKSRAEFTPLSLMVSGLL